jgi:GR25 family glycosyltransferase involved in LPS biosynthesis
MREDGYSMSDVKAYVLGLKNKFRGAALINDLSTLGLGPKIVWGLDVDDFEVEFLDGMIDQNKCRAILGRELSYSELSCALGHLEMYEEFLSDGSEWGVFLEDDARLGDEFFLLVSHATSLLAPAVLSLASLNDPRFEPRPFPLLRENLDNLAFTNFFKCAIPPVLAHGYLMNRSAALIAVHTLRGKKIFTPADFPFDFRNSVSFYVSETEYVGVRQIPSTIEASRVLSLRDKNPNKLIEYLKRRLRVLIDYSGWGVLRARKLGISGKFYFREKVMLRQAYKKFRKQSSSKFLQ